MPEKTLFDGRLGDVATVEDLISTIQDEDPDFLPADTTGLLKGADFQVGMRLGGRLSGVKPFNHRPAIDLLEEAALLLDKCLSLRASKQELEVKAIEQWLEFRNFFLENDIHEQLVAAGELDLGYKIATIEQTAQQEVLLRAKEADLNYANSILSRTPGNILHDKKINLSSLVTQLSSYSNAQELKDFAKELAIAQMQYEKEAVEASKSAAASTVAHVNGQLAIAATKAGYENVSKELRRELQRTRKETMIRKAVAAMRPGVGSNFKERLYELQALFDEDFLSAYSRLAAAQKGLKELFEIVAPLPDLETSPLSAYVVWLRQRLDDISQIQESHWALELELSLSKLMGESTWKSLLRSGSAKFVVPADLLKNLSSVRLQSVGAYIEGGGSKRVQTLSLRPPRSASYTTLSGQSKLLNQEDVPKITLGAIRERSDANDIGFLSARSLINVSPFGEWEVELRENKYLPSDSTGDLPGIILVLRCQAASLA